MGKKIDKNKYNIKKGDIIEIGKHRLMCGDSTNINDVEKLMNNKKADMVFTSPPYNANIEMTNNFKARKGKIYNKYNDNKTSVEYINFLKTVLKILFKKTKGLIYFNINYNAKSKYEFIDIIYPFRKELNDIIIWLKSSAIFNLLGITRRFEFIFLFNHNKVKIKNDKKYISNVWKINNTKSNIDSLLGCYPIELVEKGILLSSKQNDIILDLFLGSGTTLIASEKTNRVCYGMEIDEHYCSIIMQRYIDSIGKNDIKINGKKF